MGCCLSKANDFTNTPPPPFPPPTHFQVPESDPHPAKAPLSPVFEEESVKEVLSEIPNPKPKPHPIPEEPKQSSTLLQMQKGGEAKKDEDNKKPTPPVSKVEEDVKKGRKIEVVNHNAASPEISEVSEICSLSESISTTTLTERKEDEDGEVVQQRVHRSPAKSLRKRSIPGDFMGKHERGSKSPARRLNPSPLRRNDEVSQSHTARRRISSSENNTTRVKRDQNERSGRRSRSPATRVNSGGNRSGSSGRSPARKPPPPARTTTPPPPAVAALPEGNERKEEEEEEEETKEENGWTKESIENPHVSLECFIFL